MNELDTQKLQKLMGALEGDNLSKDDALIIINSLVQLIKSVQKNVKTELDKSLQEHNQKVFGVLNKLEASKRITADIKKELEQKIYDVEVSIPAQFDSSSMERSLRSELQSSINTAIERVKAWIPNVKELLRPEAIRNKLESLQGEDRLDAKAIKNLDLIVKKLAQSSQNTIYYGGGGARGKVKNYDLSSSLDGVTKTFNIPANYTLISVASTSRPTVFRPTIDYTWTGTTITFTSEINAATTLASGQTLVIIYEEA